MTIPTALSQLLVLLYKMGVAAVNVFYRYYSKDKCLILLLLLVS